MKLIDLGYDAHILIAELFPNGPVYDNGYAFIGFWDILTQTIGQLTMITGDDT